MEQQADAGALGHRPSEPPNPTVLTGPMSAFEEYLADWRFREDWRPVVERLGPRHEPAQWGAGA